MRSALTLHVLALVGLGLAGSACASEAEAPAEDEASLERDEGAITVSTAETVFRMLHRTDPTGLLTFPRGGDEVAATLRDEVTPKLEDAGRGLAPWDYLRRMGPLGHLGPLGAYGPIGHLGPVGGRPWNPDLYISGVVPWSDWSELLTREGGPLSADGPLGSKGPLDPYFWDQLPERLRARVRDADLSAEDKEKLLAVLNDGFVAHLRPGGIFGILGPAGVSGALGPLGPLGTIGAHGYVRRDGGHFHPRGDRCHDAPRGYERPPCRKISVEWERGGDKRDYELFEVYDENEAKKLDGSGDDRWNDTSFMVKGTIAMMMPDEYRFRSEHDQWVSVLVLPETARYSFRQAIKPRVVCRSLLESASRAGFEPPLFVNMPAPFGITRCLPAPYDHQGSYDDFDVELTIEHEGKQARVSSRSRDMLDWVEMKVPKGSVITARVSLARIWLDPMIPRVEFPPYRLVVVGATKHGTARTRFSGPYVDKATLR